MTESLVHTIKSVKFSISKFREGYDMIEVDSFLDELIAAIQLNPGFQPSTGFQQSQLPDQILHKKFQTTKFREGYDMDEVDNFLDLVLAQTRNLFTDADAVAGASGARAPVTSTLTDSFLSNAKFNQGGIRRGYSQQDVHALISRIRHTVAGGDLRAIADLPNTATTAQLSKVGGGTGYRVSEVKAFLSEVHRRATGQ